MAKFHKLLLLAVLGLCACAAAPVAVDGSCANGAFTIDARFESGDLDQCEFTSDTSVALTFLPEDQKVDGAFSWFAFRVTSNVTRNIEIELRFPTAYARYWPKISADGHSWAPADAASVKRSEDGKSINLVVAADNDGTWVSAQELVTMPFYEDWLAELRAHEDIETSTIGSSAQGRPIFLASTLYKPEVVVLIGRQHPAEVPGALAMREFVDVVLADTELARAFRKRFTLLIIPLINPDGVVNGHSRHNAAETDLNRDWGPFTQPETQSVERLLADVDKHNVRPRLMLDFHATKMTPTMIFYTQVPEDNTEPPLFASTWLSRVAERIVDYEFTHDPRPPSGLNNTKNYFLQRYGIPAITYEIGDEANLDEVRTFTPVFAEEMMQTMLESECLLRAEHGARPCSGHLTVE